MKWIPKRKEYMFGTPILIGESFPTHATHCNSFINNFIYNEPEPLMPLTY
jgi:hypothetical protein